MSYRLLSFKTDEKHNVDQWKGRDLAGELRSFGDRTLVRIFEKFLSGRELNILEGGCGVGAWCEWFQNQGHDIIGIENNDDVVEQARDFKPNVAVELGDITNLRFSANEFDAYISLGVIEHFEDGPEAALREAHRILKPNGLAFVTTPYLSPLRRLASHPVRSLYFLTRKLTGRSSYFWEYRFTEAELRWYLEKAGFEIIYKDIDDYEPEVTDRHIGLWADWYFLREIDGEIWELNTLGKTILHILKLFPSSWYCSGLHLVARAKKRVAVHKTEDIPVESTIERY